MKTLLIVIAPLCLLVAAPPVVAQSVCDECQNNSEDGPHRFQSPGDDWDWEPFDYHSGWLTGACGDLHYSCGLGEQELEALALAIDAADVDLARALLTRFQNTAYDFRRGTVDIRCGETLVAVVPAPWAIGIAIVTD